MTASPPSARVLLVEDDESLRTVLASELRRARFDVATHATGTQVVEAVRRHEPDVVLLDLHLPGAPGIDVLGALHQHDPDLPVVVCTGHGTVGIAVEAMRRGAFDFLTKPIALEVLEQTIRRAVNHGALVRDNHRLRRAAALAATTTVAVAPESEAGRRLDQLVARLASAEQSVLITGESGTGKELVARRLHALSARHTQPFVVLHCGAVPRQLVESELFGHVKGAFTGADQKRPGLFDAAHGGTIFLDEVGELPPDVQPALLRAVQFGEIRPVGSDTTKRVDVRIVAATNRDLRAQVDAGAYREDLSYRLAVLEVRVPPLRDRPEDVATLALAMLAREAARSGRQLSFDDAAIARLRQHRWPGNVRELENAVVRLGVLADGPVVTAADVDEHVFAGKRATTSIGTLPTLELAELERLAIAAALQRFDGNKTKAAQALGIALKTLYNRLNAAAEDAGDEPKPDTAS